MRARRIFAGILVWAGTWALAAGVATGCSSSTSGGSGTQGGGEGGATSETGAGSETGSGSDAGTGADGAEDSGAHDAPAPDALYGCAVQGSFGWTCTATTTGPDPTECTDPAFPDCFVGGQGAWCSSTCASATDCTGGAVDASCAPTSCNSKGYCK
ncbi:MAG: hypothetical protein ACRELB_20160 [Polyangiaceae bacterium]